MEVTAKFLGGSRFLAETRGHEVICDQPLDNGGDDTGMTPPEFLLASLATCGGYYAAQYLKTRGLDSGGLEVRVEAGKAKGPARLEDFRIEVRLPEIEERHRGPLLRAVKACLVHNTLSFSPRIETVLIACNSEAVVS